MKNLSVIAILFLSLSLSAQEFVDKKGTVHFFSAATIENIEATSHTAVCAMNTGSKKVVAKIPITGFVFKDKLMQEHFNENYMESDKFPYAVLNGVIQENIDFNKDGVYDVTIKGTIEIHGVKADKDIKGKLTMKGGVPVNATAKFDVKLADHKIKIPSLLGSNIAESEAVDVNFNFEKYEKK
ncbi:MAG: YceI family protein [Bacteroidetes bacterium]|nr:YceI family protein [Bacteroidota bacterium]